MSCQSLSKRSCYIRRCDLPYRVILIEQPVSAFFYASPKNNILVTGELLPKSRFLGNSAATIMEGEDRIRLLDRPEDGEYCISVSLRIEALEA